MAEVPVKNYGKIDMHIGGKLIPAGETKFVDERFVATKQAPPETPAETEPNPVLDILKQNVKQVAEALAAVSAEDLDALELAESAAENPRKGVLEAVNIERLSRANEVQETEEFIAELKAMNEEDLTDAMDTFRNDDGKMALINEEVDRRASEAE